jgi:hypothetical protein
MKAQSIAKDGNTTLYTMYSNYDHELNTTSLMS